MSDSITVKKGLGKKAKNAFSGVIIGLLMFLMSFPLLWWNEGRSVERIKTTNEGRELVSAISSKQILPINQDKLVHFSGFADTQKPLMDDLFSVSAKAIKIQRKVEMYQWKETKKEREDKTTYSYEKTWSEDYIDSSRFHQPQGHENPSKMPFESKTFIADDVFIDAFKISTPFVTQIKNYDTYLLSNEDYAKLKPQLQNAFKLNGNEYFYGNPQSPQIGAVRVSFQTAKPLNVSVMGKQSGEWLQVFQTKHGKLSLLDEGTVDEMQMLQNAEDENTMLTWMLRGLGVFLMWTGLGLLMGPLKMLANYIPIFGTLFEGAVMIVSGLVAICLSFLTIALAWLFFRPLLSIALIAIAGSAIYVLAKKVKAPKDEGINEDLIETPTS